MNITLITAIGNQGQIGTDNHLPWRAADDLRNFRDKTTDGLLIVGWNTFQSISHLLINLNGTVNGRSHYAATHGRDVVIDNPDLSAAEAVEIAACLGKNRVWIAGGARTYSRWVRNVTDIDVTLIDYNGPADCFFPFNSVRTAFDENEILTGAQEELLKWALICEKNRPNYQPLAAV